MAFATNTTSYATPTFNTAPVNGYGYPITVNTTSSATAGSGMGAMGAMGSMGYALAANPMAYNNPYGSTNATYVVPYMTNMTSSGTTTSTTSSAGVRIINSNHHPY